MTSKIVVPSSGKKITVNADNTLNVPNQPIIPFIEGDGIGVDITPPMIKVVDAAVNKAYSGTLMGCMAHLENSGERIGKAEVYLADSFK